MAAFIVVAAVMAALAAAAVVVPLWRDRGSRVLGVVAGVLLVGSAAGLYPLWSTWDWHAAGSAPGVPPEVLAMVAKLRDHLQQEPKDAPGWLMLGRSEMELEHLDEAIVAYEHAHELDADSAEAALGLGEALSLRSGGTIPVQASALFEQALRLAPQSPKALLYGGFAAAARGDEAAARSRWEALKALHPPEQIVQLLDARLAELGADSGAPGAPPGPSRAAGAAGAQLKAAQVTVNLRIAPALKARLTHEVPLFVFARAPGGAGPPLAAKRLTSAAIGTQIQLSAADSMMAGRQLESGAQVSITARVSFSGQPLPAAGDLYGELTYDVGRDGVRDLVIDRIAD
jgi:cytochrome c-type biogenesis protein CcmH